MSKTSFVFDEAVLSEIHVFPRKMGPRRWNNEADSTEMTSKFLQNWRDFWRKLKRYLMKNEFICYEALFKEIHVFPRKSSRQQWKNDPDNMKTRAKIEEKRREFSNEWLVVDDEFYWRSNLNSKDELSMAWFFQIISTISGRHYMATSLNELKKNRDKKDAQPISRHLVLSNNLSHAIWSETKDRHLVY